MRYQIVLLSFLIPFFLVSQSTPNTDFNGETHTIPSEGGIEIKAEFYKTECGKKPLILLFHQAGYSRGEYREIGPKLNELGFCALAIDQRSGNKVNGVINESSLQAKEKGLETKYVNALSDLKATVDYMVAKNHTSNGVILLGSSYSSSLIFILGTEYPDLVKGLIAFSPGEYFTYNDKKISGYAKDISCPVFITSSGSEKDKWESIYQNVTSKKQFYLPDFAGFHGAKALWSKNEGNDKYWAELKGFLSNY